MSSAEYLPYAEGDENILAEVALLQSEIRDKFEAGTSGDPEAGMSCAMIEHFQSRDGSLALERIRGGTFPDKEKGKPGRIYIIDAGDAHALFLFGPQQAYETQIWIPHEPTLIRVPDEMAFDYLSLMRRKLSLTTFATNETAIFAHRYAQKKSGRWWMYAAGLN